MPEPQPVPRRWPFGFTAVLAAIAGLSASLAFAPYGLWPVAVAAVAALTWAVHRARGLWRSVALGWFFGLAFMGTSLHWQTSILTASYLGLTLATSLMYAAVGGLLKTVEVLPVPVLWSAAVWSVGEWVLSVWPFEGFMWMRLGYSQVDSPLAGYYPFVGAATVTFLVAGLGALLASLVESPTRRRAVVAAIVIAGVLGLGALGRLWSPAGEGSGTVDVGWVQGGAPGGGVFGLGPARTITTNQARETVALTQAVAAGEQRRPAFIVWPENSTDLDPRADAETGQLVQGAVDYAGVPILVGSVYEGPGVEERQTVSVWWTQDGPQQVYAKQNLVPFGEWIPFRSFLLPLIPELAYVGAQSVPGTAPGVIDATLPEGDALRLGVAICYEVIYPQTVFEAGGAGADLFVVVSSNAMYQGTNQIDQQFAITRVRAAEMRRDVLVVTTSGVSGRIGSHGEVLWIAPDHVSASGVEAMPLAHPVTPVMRWGGAVEMVLVAVGLFGVAAGAFRRVSTGRGGTMVDAAETVSGE